MDSSDRNVTDVDGVRLVFHGHEEEQETVEELDSAEWRNTHEKKDSVENWHRNQTEDFGEHD